MIELASAAGRITLDAGTVVITRRTSRVEVPAADVVDVVIGERFVQVKLTGQPAATGISAPHDPTAIEIVRTDAPAAAALRDAVLAAKEGPRPGPTGTDFLAAAAQSLPVPPAPAPGPPPRLPGVSDVLPSPAPSGYGAPSRDRPDIKAAYYWFRALVDLPATDRWLIAEVATDELVIGAFEVWTDSTAGWQPLLITDRRVLRAVEKPEPAIYEMPLGPIIGVARDEIKDNLVKARIIDRTGYFTVWLRNETAYYRFFSELTSVRSYPAACKAPAPEPVRGQDVLSQFDAFTALLGQIKAGTVPEPEVRTRTAAVFGVPPGELPEERGWSGM